MNASAKIIQCLASHGLKYICGIPGEDTTSFLQALAHDGGNIRFILTRHEQGAAYICDAIARITGEPQALLTKAGPGLTNAVTSIANSYLDKVPLIVISGQLETKKLHKSSYQLLDSIAMLRPMTHYNEMILHVEAIPEIVFKCFQKSKYGPTHFNLPIDVAKWQVPDHVQPIARSTQQQSFPDINLLREAFNSIQKSKHPILLLGQGALEAVNEIRSFGQNAAVFSVCTPRSKGIIPYSSEYSLYTVGFEFPDPNLVQALQQSDCIITVGYDQNEFPPEFWNKNKHANIVYLHSIATEVNQFFVPKFEVLGSISVAFQYLNSWLNETGFTFAKSSVMQQTRSIIEHQWDQFKDSKQTGKILPQKVLYDVRKRMHANDILVSDVGQHMLYVNRYFQCDQPNTCLIATAFSPMGYGLPTAIGAKLVKPDQNVVLIAGDGGFMMNVCEMETAVRIGTKLVVIIFKDNEYGMIHYEQERLVQEHMFIEFGNPSFKDLASSFGWDSCCCDNSAEFGSVFQKALDGTKSMLIEVPIDYSRNDTLTSEA